MPTLDEILTEVSREQRVCPNPIHWNRLWKILHNHQKRHGGSEPAAPLILGAWWVTGDDEKRKRFHDHIHWADKYGVLNEVADFLLKMDSKDWLREGKITPE